VNTVSREQVEVAVAIEVADPYGARIAAHGHLRAGAEGAVALVEAHAYRTVVIVSREQVEVAVHIAHHNVFRGTAHAYFTAPIKVPGPAPAAVVNWYT